MIINRIVKKVFDVCLLGLSISEVQNLNMSVRDVSDCSEAKDDNGVLCVIYDDMPLLTEKVLRALAKVCVNENCGFSLGNGFITKSGYCGTLRSVWIKETETYLPERHSYFVSVLQKKINAFHARNGVIIENSDSTFIDFTVKICAKAVIEPFVTISGNSYIGKKASIRQHSVITDSVVGDGCEVRASTLENSTVGDRSTVGPYAYLRNNARIGKDCRIGDFVEIKNSILADGVKAAHHSYVGDAEIGSATNVGCGTVFCNYDGKKKHRTVVGEKVFIGANCNLVAPIEVGNGAFIAAGSTVTRSVDENAFVIARSKQITKSFTGCKN